MKNLRKKRLVDLLNSPRFNGDRSAFLSSAGLSKGRLTQLLDPDMAFGDAAARNLCESLSLPDGWFDALETAEQTKATSADTIPPELMVVFNLYMRLPNADKRDRAFAGMVQAIEQARDSPAPHKAMPETGAKRAA